MVFHAAEWPNYSGEFSASCPFTLTGSARLEGQVIRIEYSGNTCIGSMSETELLERS